MRSKSSDFPTQDMNSKKKEEMRTYFSFDNFVEYDFIKQMNKLQNM